MIYASLGLLVAGLCLGVYAMLHGTERQVQSSFAPHERVSEHDPLAEPSALLNFASLAAFCFGAGLTLYLLNRFLDWPLLAEIVSGAVVGAGAMALQSLLIARWAIPSARAEHVDHRYLLQGTIGQIVTPVSEGAEGTGLGEGLFHYELDGKSYDLPARSVDGSRLPAGADVVIDRVDNGVAFVEAWAAVEQRL